MKTFHFNTSHTINSPLSQVFDFFSRAENLEKLTPDWLNFKILTPLPIAMEQGTLIDYQIRMMGFAMNWKTEITAWEPQIRFIDTQIKGPYRRWVHEHRFEERDGRTIMHDSVEYAIPGGFISGFINKFFIRPRIKSIFFYREQIINSLFP